MSDYGITFKSDLENQEILLQQEGSRIIEGLIFVPPSEKLRKTMIKNVMLSRFFILEIIGKQKINRNVLKVNKGYNNPLSITNKTLYSNNLLWI